MADGHDTIEVELAAGRWKHLIWAVIGLGAGLFVAIQMGSIGWVIGGAVALGGVKSLWLFVKTLLHPPGAVIVRDKEIVVPVGGASSGMATTVPADELRNAYVLRRAVPWLQTGPVLVIETRREIFELPRDWFDSDADQRNVASTLNRRLGRIP
jgi:hypothetical protein